jgi:hypothetical protein
MALPSQTSSGAPGGRGRLGRGGKRRRSGRRRLAVVAVVLLGAGGATLWLLRSDPAEAKAGDATLAINEPKPQQSTPHELRAPAPAESARAAPAPIELTQRRGAAALPEPGVSRQEEDQARDEPPPPPPTRETQPAGGGRTRGAEVGALIQVGEERLQSSDPIGARRLLNDALRHPQATEADRATVRSLMSQINEDLVFSPRLLTGDPLVETYTIQSGDSLAKITNRLGLAVDYRFLSRVNRLSSPDRISVGQTLKLVRGPFHAIVSKSAYRMDLYAGPGENPSEWLYITSRRVGLGEEGGTPTGVFVVRRESKLINPFWTNPRTGEQFDADDPRNPIGERWIGLRGLADAAAFAGYGVHGTIDPDSIGKQRSMGCIRMLPEDVELVYEMLAEEVSYVHIVP